MSLRPDQIDELASKYVVSLYTELERLVIADIARRVKKAGRYTETAELMVKAMRQQGFSPSRIEREVMKKLRADSRFKRDVADNTKLYKMYVKQLVKDTVKKAKKEGDELVSRAGNMAWNDDLRVWKQHGISIKKTPVFRSLIEAFKKQTFNELKNITRSAAFKGTLLGTVSIMNAYQRALDMAVLKTVTGTFSSQQAIRDAIKELAASGLRSIDYKSGRTYQLDTAARMCVRTTCSQLAGKISEENIQKTDVDLVYVSAHATARPTHALWQGKVYYFDENKPVKGYGWIRDKEPHEGGNGCGYGSMLGLKGINCTHEFYPYWEGDPIPEYTPHPDVTVNGKTYTYYEATQEQRRRERAIRATKREIEAMQALGEDTTDLRAKLRQMNADYKAFSVAADLRPKTDRLQVIRGTSDLGKTNTQKSNFRDKLLKAAIENAQSNGWNCYDATYIWKHDATPGKGKLINAEKVTINNIDYIVDGENVILDYSQEEKDTAELLIKTFGGNVILNPKVNKPEGIRVADYVYKDEFYDLKSAKGKSKHVIYGLVKGNGNQAHNFVIDVTNCPLSLEEIYLQITEDVYKSSHTSFLKNLILKKGNKILKVYERI